VSPGAKSLVTRSGGRSLPETERIFIISDRVLCRKVNVYPLFPLIHDKCQGHKNPSRHSIYLMHFKLVGLASTDHYFLRERDIE